MSRLILITSAKGGVGKTTLSSNLAAALAEQGEDVIVIDANLTTPNLGLHLGMHLTQKTLHHVLSGKSRLKDAIYPHPQGFKVIPASLALSDLSGIDAGRLPEVTFSLLGKADYIIMDCAAGLGREAISALAASNEIIVVTNPNLPAVTDALKVTKLAQESNIKVIGAVINRVKGKKHELTSEQVEDLLSVPILGEIPEDSKVDESIAEKKTLIEYSPESPAAVEITKLAHVLTGRRFEKKSKPLYQRFFGRIKDWFAE